jgi:cbb3-type cytochrome oxidase maturation protein
MNVILILILASLGMALLFLGGFIWAVMSGQFDDTQTPGMRVLADESSPPKSFRQAAADSHFTAASSANIQPSLEQSNARKPI